VSETCWYSSLGYGTSTVCDLEIEEAVAELGPGRSDAVMIGLVVSRESCRWLHNAQPATPPVPMAANALTPADAADHGAESMGPSLRAGSRLRSARDVARWRLAVGPSRE
jgi:hypothetical protein